MVSASGIGIVSPGAMGSALGAAWQRGGARVFATVAGRSGRTRELARGLELLSSLRDVIDASDVLVSVGGGSTITVVALMTAVAESPAFRPSSSAASRVMSETMRYGPQAMSIWAITSSRRTARTIPARRLRALPPDAARSRSSRASSSELM